MADQTISGPTQTAVEGASKEWAPRPIVAGATRLAIFLFPYVAGFTVAVIASRSFSAQKLGLNPIVWFVGVAGISTLIMIPADRLVRRLVPITGLLTVALGFPDAAPSRFKVAMRSTTTKQLQRRIDEALGQDEVRADIDRNQYLLDLVAALTRHDRLTRGHSERVRAYATLIGEELRLSKADQQKLYWAALLHDIGKLDVPTEILNKNGRPDEEEWKILQGHPGAAERYLAPLQGWLGEWGRAATEHHLRWDGKGYPRDIGGIEIGFAGRVVAIADAYDVMTSARSYKKPMSAADARVELSRCAGGQFDPHLVRAFLNIGLGRVRLAGGMLASLPALVNAILATLATNGGRVLLATTMVTGGVTAAPLVEAVPPLFAGVVTESTEVASGERGALATVVPTRPAPIPVQTTSSSAVLIADPTPTAIPTQVSVRSPRFESDVQDSEALPPSPTVLAATAVPTASTTNTQPPTPSPSATPGTGSTVAIDLVVTPTATPQPTAAPPVPTPSLPTATPQPTAATPVPTTTSLPTATPLPTAAPLPTATPQPTAAPLPTATPQPTATPVPQPTATPLPTATPIAILVPEGEDCDDVRNGNTQPGEAADLASCQLANINIAEAEWSKVIAVGVVLTNAQADGAKFDEAVLTAADFSGASVRNALFPKVSGEGMKFDGADLSDAEFDDANLRDASFVGANLSGTKLQATDFTNADFTGAIGIPSDTDDAIFLNTTCPDGTVIDAGDCWG